jgi:hypothetical protein
MQQCRVQKNVAEQKLCIWALPWHQPLLMIDLNSFVIQALTGPSWRTPKPSRQM